MAEELKTDDIEVSPALQAQEAEEAKAEPKAKEIAEAPAETAPESEAAETDAGPEGDEGAENEADEKGEKERSKPASKRIAELTKARREAERRADELEARLARLEADKSPADDKSSAKPDPNDAKYEFGEADPEYIADLVEWKAEAKFAERDAKAKEEAAAERFKAQVEALNAAWAEKAEKAVEKYPDFHEKVIESAAAQEWDLLPLSAAAVQGSEVGDDIAYHLATHPEDAKRLADAERGFFAARDAALRAGMQFEVANMLAAPYLMRGQEIFEGVEAQYKGAANKKPVKHVTDAPEPAQERVRGGSGQFAPDFSSDTCDLAALNKAIRG